MYLDCVEWYEKLTKSMIRRTLKPSQSTVKCSCSKAYLLEAREEIFATPATMYSQTTHNFTEQYNIVKSDLPRLWLIQNKKKSMIVGERAANNKCNVHNNYLHYRERGVDLAGSYSTWTIYRDF